MNEFPNEIGRQRMYKKMKQTFQILSETQKQKNNIHNLIEQTIRDCIIKKGGCEDSLMIFSDISQSEEGFVVKVLFRRVDGLALDLVQYIAWEFDVDDEDMVIRSTRVPHEIVLQFLVKEKEKIRTCNECKHMTSTVTDEELGDDGDYHWEYILVCEKEGIPAMATRIEDVYDANNCEYYEDKYDEDKEEWRIE